MGARGGTLLPRHERRLRASFVLTSLIDVIFLLVIFFMVSSQVTPFSTIRLGAVAERSEEPAPPADATAADPPAAAAAVRKTVPVRILAGRVSIDGTLYPRAEAAEAIGKLAKEGVAGLVLLPATSSTVQDLVTVLEAATDAGIADISIVSTGRARP